MSERSIEAVFEARTLPELLQTRANQRPNDPAFRDTLGTAWTLGELRDRVNGLTAGLQSLGIGPGDVVTVMAANRPEYLEAWFAIAQSGAVFNPVNAQFTRHEIAYVVGDAGARAVIADARALALIQEDRGSFSGVEHLVGFDVPQAEDGEVRSFDALRLASVPAPVAIAPDDLASLVYTSGTTGKPKGAMLSHGNYLANAAQSAELLPLRRGDRAGMILPLFHANAQLVTTVIPLLVGAEILMMPPFSASTFWATVAEHRPTTFSSVPMILAALLHAPGADTADTSALEYVVCGAAPLTRALLMRFEATFGIRVLEGYGLTESTCVSTINPYWGPRKAGSIGLPLRGQEILIVDDAGNPLPDGEPGELCIRGSNIMGGYYGLPEATADTLRDGWLYTGDVAYRDEDGFLFLIDRSKDMIIRAGENIYPREIEEVLATHDAVQDVAVIGRPDEVRGEEVHAVLVLAPGTDLADIQAHAMERLARFKRPTSWEVVADLPRTSTGKTDKKALRAALAAPTA